jgi:DNA ligase-associated metallophosphoesterase
MADPKRGSECMPSRGAVALTLGGQRMELLPAGGLWWPAERRLLVADAHLGHRGSTRSSVGVTNASTLARIADLLIATDAAELWILGDLFDASSTVLRSAVEAEWTAFRSTISEQRVCLVPGNHDRTASRWASRLDVELAGPLAVFGELTLVHDPDQSPEYRDTIAGHLHPGWRAPSAGGDWIPCFWLRGRCLVLPAISGLTSRAGLPVEASDRVWAFGGGELIEQSIEQSPNA